MQIPKTPSTFEELDLIQQLKEYSKSDTEVAKLFTNITSFVKDMLTPLLGKINAREMETFTMHDPNHALKVAHLMWYIIKPERRDKLTPPEIALLVVSAFLHDLGMALSPQEREERLGPDSDLWQLLEVDEELKKSLNQLKDEASNSQSSELIRGRARHQLYQAEETLLCRDTRQRHASRERYEELLTQLQQFHNKAPSKLPDVESCLSFAGDSFREKVIEICVSHGQDLDFLLENDETNIERPRFPMDYTLGSCIADLHMVAAALRLADILDFDRERTPPVLFYYLLPTNLAPQESKSVLEWSKHLSISNWHIEEDAIVFRGHCSSHIIHHAVVHFCSDIEKEIKSTRDTFSIRNTDFSFNLPKSVQTKIEQHGYTYVPYKFELDDNRVYQLLMGGAIYDNPLVAVRELVQNAVDACKLKDAWTRMYEPQTTPNTTNRITIRYEEPTEQCPQSKLTIRDTGTGMDKWILEKYFLKVGMSYYNSPDFNKIRFQLRTKNEELDFAPISEFGIGFLSCFLLADRLQVDTAMWDSIRGDTLKRTLIIDGPTRLIRMSEKRNERLDRFKGTSVTLYLARGSGNDKNQPPQLHEIKRYLIDVCQDLPYRLNLEHLSPDGQVTCDYIDRTPLTVQLPERLEPLSVRIPVNDHESGLEGEIALVSPYHARKLEQKLVEGSPVSIADQSKSSQSESTLLRGGFKIGEVPGLPRSYLVSITSKATLRFNWKFDSHRRYPMPNLARNRAANSQLLHQNVLRIWLGYLLSNVDCLPEGLLNSLSLPMLPLATWRMEQDNALIMNPTWMEQYNALTIYTLARQGWFFVVGDKPDIALQTWESSTGESLRLGSSFRDELYWQLLDMILPKITTLQMARGISFYVKPPEPGWRKILEGWQNYSTSAVQWGPFVEYIGDIENLLAYEYPGSVQFNSRFRKRLLKSFSKNELPPLLKVLHKLADARGASRQAMLTDNQVSLLKRAQKHLGDIEIGELAGSWRIDSFAVPKVVNSQ